MVNKYLLLYNTECEHHWRGIEGTAVDHVAFLKEVDDGILLNKEWTLYSVSSETEKKTYISSGIIDKVTEEEP